MDPDSPWEDSPSVDRAPEAEWNRIASDYTNSGYREGIIAGKEASLQIGFDDGFATVGVPLGRQLGNLRGVVAALGSVLNSQNPDSPELQELHSISSTLSSIRFSDIAPPDIEAEQHAKEHLGFEDPAVVENKESGPDIVSRERYMIQNVADVKKRLVLLSAKLKLSTLA